MRDALEIMRKLMDVNVMVKEFIKEDSKMGAGMGEENFNGKMVNFLKVNGLWAEKMGGANGNHLKEIDMKVNGRIIGNKEEELFATEEDLDI